MVIQRESSSSQEEAKKFFLQQTIKIWQPRTLRELTYEDARQVTENAVGFFQVLEEWEKKEKSKIYS
jgi:hypothetical protein